MAKTLSRFKYFCNCNTSSDVYTLTVVLYSDSIKVYIARAGGSTGRCCRQTHPAPQAGLCTKPLWPVLIKSPARTRAVVLARLLSSFALTSAHCAVVDAAGKAGSPLARSACFSAVALFPPRCSRGVGIAWCRRTQNHNDALLCTTAIQWCICAENLK